MNASATMERECSTSVREVKVEVLGAGELPRSEDALGYQDALRWLAVLKQGFGHEPYCIRAVSDGRTCGLLPLAFVRSLLFGRFLVSLPYVNSAGVIADNDEVAEQLLNEAVRLANRLDVRYLELRQQQARSHPALTHTNTAKVLMRLPLPGSVEELWSGFKSKLRSQIKAGLNRDFEIAWGSQELLPEFYSVFSRNMRDLGTPVYSAQLFAAILENFGAQAEICVARLRGLPVASALLMHYADTTEVPSASSLRTHNDTNANMVLYWHLLSRATARGQKSFDFGRSSEGSGTHRFKAQWGASGCPSFWQYHLRRGSIADMRPENSRYGLAIKAWRRLPLGVTRWIGPTIVRGIP